ncbi:hypothetical protein BBJ28_00026048 [Nothophytophthora sp. Chile5]|nr:hypothetical protein BBJ28_00026048 [Nothophytophthora sp. Chile5]
MAAEAEALELTATSNPYLAFYRQFCAEHPGELTAVFDPELSDERRSEMYAALDVGVAMVRSHAAFRLEHNDQLPMQLRIPGNIQRAICSWLRGVDIVAYDLHVASDDDNVQEGEGGESDGEKDRESGKNAATSGEESHDDADEQEQSDGEEADEESDGSEEHEEDAEEEEEEVEVEQVYWADVQKGTPKDLRKHADRALFLCYPDDFEDSEESMAMASLCNYAGDTVIHVGELFGHTFQTHLATVYHKVLQVPLPSWHSSMDTLTVWKRTKSSITDGGMYAFIPTEERLDLVAACPATQHLLHFGSPEGGNGSVTKAKKRHRTKRKARPTEHVEEENQESDSESSAQVGKTVASKKNGEDESSVVEHEGSSHSKRKRKRTPNQAKRG